MGLNVTAYLRGVERTTNLFDMSFIARIFSQNNFFPLMGFCLAFGTSGLPTVASAEERGLEATIAPHLGFGVGSAGSTRYGLDFFRFSKGTSLLLQYGTGSARNEVSGILRLSGDSDIFGGSRSGGLQYGVGIGYIYGLESSSTAGDQTGAAIANPFLRYVIDYNSWVGTYFELGYEIAFYAIRHGDNAPVQSAIRSANNRFIFAIGIPFEVERSTD